MIMWIMSRSADAMCFARHNHGTGSDNSVENQALLSNISTGNIIVWFNANVEDFTSEKIDELTHLVVKEKPHLVFFQETWLTKDSSTDDETSVPGYNIFQKDRSNGVHGSVKF